MKAAPAHTSAPAAAMAQVARPAAVGKSQAFKAARALKPASFNRTVASKALRAARVESRVVVVRAADDKVVVIGLAADSGETHYWWTMGRQWRMGKCWWFCGMLCQMGVGALGWRR